MVATLPFSLDTLRSHAIFIPPSTGSSEDEWEIVDAPRDGLPAPKNARLAMRDKDLLVAFGREIRMTSLAGEGWEVHDGMVGGYKTLKSPHLTFPIHQLVLNPTGRLLAVVGHHQLVILVLPRAGFASSVGGDVVCRSFPIDEFQHSPSSTTPITQIRWHPWGEGGNSLWVMTADGKLFEYDVLRPQDPVQTFNFLPEKTGSSTSRFSAIDPLSQYATSFCFSRGSMDFGPMMVYALIANGNIYTMGPVIPRHAEVPATYLQTLQAWMAEKERRLTESPEGSTAEHAALLGRASMQSQWINSVVRQASGEDEEEQANSPHRGYGLREPSPSPSEDRSPPPPGMIRVHPPHLTRNGGPAPGVHRPILRQGPLLLDPAPQEVGNGDEIDEQMATDMFILEAGAEAEGEERLNVVAIAWSGGRVDLGAAIDTPEPRWFSSRDPAPADIVLPIIESALVPFPEDVDAEAMALNAPSFLPDTVHPDVVYVQHSFGVDAISVAPWVTQLLGGSDEPPAPSDVASLVEASPSKPTVGSVTFCNITLGYGLLALATTGQLAAVEMDFRVQDRGLPPPQEDPVPDTDSRSLLTKPFDYDALLAPIRSPSTPFNPMGAVRKVRGSAKPIESIGPEHLRALADASSQVSARAQAVRNGSALTERRVDLAITESARQLKSLRDASAGITSVRDRAAANAVRASAMAETQSSISDRLDVVLNTLLSEYRPQIGDVERKWFDELERLRARVQGAGKRPQGMQHKAQVLREQLGVVRPLLEKQTVEAQNQQYGNKQLRPLRSALDERSDELTRMMRKMEGLSVRIDEEDEVWRQ